MATTPPATSAGRQQVLRSDGGEQPDSGAREHGRDHRHHGADRSPGVTPNLAPGVYRVGTLAGTGKRSAVHRTAAQRQPAAMLDPFSLGSWCWSEMIASCRRSRPAARSMGCVARLPVIELRENRRQVAPWERDALALLRDGRGDEALERYREHDRVRLGG
jgi:hypothetical protein